MFLPCLTIHSVCNSTTLLGQQACYNGTFCHECHCSSEFTFLANRKPSESCLPPLISSTYEIARPLSIPGDFVIGDKGTVLVANELIVNGYFLSFLASYHPLN